MELRPALLSIGIAAASASAAQADVLSGGCGVATGEMYASDLLQPSNEPLLLCDAAIEFANGFAAEGEVMAGGEEASNNARLAILYGADAGLLHVELEVGGQAYRSAGNNVGYVAAEASLKLAPPVSFGIGHAEYAGDFDVAGKRYSDSTTTVFASADSFGRTSGRIGYSWTREGREGPYVELAHVWGPGDGTVEGTFSYFRTEDEFGEEEDHFGLKAKVRF